MKKSILSTKLSQWDRKHTDYLIEIYSLNKKDIDFINRVIEIYNDNEELEHATTWLLKHFIDNGNDLSPLQVTNIVDKLDKLKYWESQLHILQIIPKIKITPELACTLESGVKAKMRSEKKFVKASAFMAYYEIVKLQPELKNEFQNICEEALLTESASIKSKIKNILKAIEQNE